MDDSCSHFQKRFKSKHATLFNFQLIEISDIETHTEKKINGYKYPLCEVVL